MMKKLAGVMAAILSVCLLAGCGSEPSATNRELNVMDVNNYVTLGDYSNIHVSVEPAEVKQEEWDELLWAVYASYVTAENGGVTDRAVKAGDTVIIDYEGKKDGVAFAGGTASDASLTIGSGQFIDGFEDGLVGVMPGNTVELNLTFPEEFRNAELAGQPVVFTVTVHYIVPSREDGMTDDVVAALGVPDVSTVEELRQYVYDYLYDSTEMVNQYNIQNAIMEQLVNTSTIEELPETFVNSYNHVFNENLAKSAASYGVDVETYANDNYAMGSADYVKLYSQVQARQEILLQAIANREGLKVSDEELQTELEELTAESGFHSVEEMLGNYDREEFRNYIMSEKVMDFLMERTTVTPVSEEEGTEAQNKGTEE